MPFSSVVTVPSCLPSGSWIRRTTPLMPFSPSSCLPLPFSSNQTRSPTLTVPSGSTGVSSSDSTKPKSRVRSLSPSLVRPSVVDSHVEESLSRPPSPSRVGDRPFSASLEAFWSISTVYFSPSFRTGKSSKRYLPFSSVVTVPSSLPSGSWIRRTTPLMSFSPSSCLPLAFSSNQTRSPTETVGLTKPKSKVMSSAPSSVSSEDWAESVEESPSRPPTPSFVGAKPSSAAPDFS